MSSHDELLEYLVKRVEVIEASINVILYVNGLIIAGNMISSKKYYDKMSTFFDETKITTDDPSLREKGRAYMQQVKQFMQEKRRSKEEQDNPKYIHLDNVVMYPSDPLKPFGANVWRGKLSSVDAFSVGTAYWEYKPVEDVTD